MNKKINDIQKLLDDNSSELSEILAIELSELGMPFILDENSYPQVFGEEDSAIAQIIYRSICAKFIYKNKK